MTFLSVCDLQRQREREGGREGETETHREIDRDRDRQRQTDRQTDRQTGRLRVSLSWLSRSDRNRHVYYPHYIID